MATRLDPPDRAGASQWIGPRVRCILAPNPSAMTYLGTNTYLLGSGEVAVIDPGPDIPSHLTALLNTLEHGEKVTHIFVTHAHLDHSAMAKRLSAQTGAPIFAFGPAHAGRRAFMAEIAASGLIGGAEGIDGAFAPDVCLSNGECVRHSDWHIRALHTPGHLSNHMCFASGDRLFGGDHVMGWSTSLVSPPDGDMFAYMTSLRTLSTEPWSIVYPGHGPVLENVADRLSELYRHRKQREAAILNLLQVTPSTPDAIALQVYQGLAEHLMSAAARNVLAHLLDLMERGLVAGVGAIGESTVFSKV